MSTGTIKQVAPTDLIVAANIRTDTKLTAEFVASIKEHGVYVPITVQETADGLAVIDGQRRTLAAVDAGVDTVPVYVVDPLADEGQRIVEQLVVNDQRASINEGEAVAAFRQLELFGMSVPAIARRTGTKRDVIKKALALVKNETAMLAFEEHELTLDQAAMIVEFAGDEKVVKELVKAASTGQIDHVAARHRTARALEEAKAVLAAELVAEGVVRLTDVGSSYEGVSEADQLLGKWTRFDRLGKPDEPTERLELGDVAGQPFVGARVTSDHKQREDGSYGLVALKQYFVLDFEENGIPPLEYASVRRELTPEEVADAEQKERERLAAAAVRAALDTAATVRWTWLIELVQRKTLSNLLPAMAKLSLVVGGDDYRGRALELIGVAKPSDGEEDAGESLKERLLRHVDAGPKNAQTLLLAGFISAAESAVNPSASWRTPDADVASVYFPLLAAWGYGLSDAELSLVNAEAADAA